MLGNDLSQRPAHSRRILRLIALERIVRGVLLLGAGPRRIKGRMDGARSAQSFPPRPGLSGLVTAGKRHARRHWILLAGMVVVVLLTAGGVGAWLGLRPTSHFGATRPLRRAFAKGDATVAGGRPSWGLGATDELKFIPSAPFMMGTELTNEAAQPLTLVAVRTVFPRDSVIRQLSVAYEAGPFCEPGMGGGRCGPREGGRNGTLGPSPLQVAPGNSAIVQLNFRFLGCPQASNASLQNVSRIALTYREPNGTIIHQRVGLASSTLAIDPVHPCSS